MRIDASKGHRRNRKQCAAIINIGPAQNKAPWTTRLEHTSPEKPKYSRNAQTTQDAQRVSLQN